MIEVVRVRIMLIGYPWILVLNILTCLLLVGVLNAYLKSFLYIWCSYLLIGVNFSMLSVS